MHPAARSPRTIGPASRDHIERAASAIVSRRRARQARPRQRSHGSPSFFDSTQWFQHRGHFACSEDAHLRRRSDRRRALRPRPSPHARDDEERGERGGRRTTRAARDRRPRRSRRARPRRSSRSDRAPPPPFFGAPLRLEARAARGGVTRAADPSATRQRGRAPERSASPVGMSFKKTRSSSPSARGCGRPDLVGGER